MKDITLLRIWTQDSAGMGFAACCAQDEAHGHIELSVEVLLRSDMALIKMSDMRRLAQQSLSTGSTILGFQATRDRLVYPIMRLVASLQSCTFDALGIHSVPSTRCLPGTDDARPSRREHEQRGQGAYTYDGDSHLESVCPSTIYMC
jgi:hypothetical protein